MTPCMYVTANCGLPGFLPTTVNDSVPIILVNYDDLPVEDTTITFSCPLGFTLTGPNSATCTDRGTWDPDPSWLMCNYSTGYRYPSICIIILC